ncbi:MAG: hypothetical protein Q7R91_00805 [bacterium]|nr:hypothetical protein [bacterium]
MAKKSTKSERREKHKKKRSVASSGKSVFLLARLRSRRPKKNNSD